MIDPLARWDFLLPDDRIARQAAEPRDSARLLVLGAALQDRVVSDLPELLREGDLVVVNDVRVRKARVRAQRESGGEIEVFLLRDDLALCRPSRRLRPGERLRVVGAGPITPVDPRTWPTGPLAPVSGAGSLPEGATITLLSRDDEGLWTIACTPDADTIAARFGSVPLPPYFHREADAQDESRYQTVYAREGGLAAAAAPTAGLHLTDDLLARLAARGVDLARVTLEVGLGTFKPLTDAQLASGELHEERYEMPDATWRALASARARGGRVVAIGTTSARVLESARGPGPGSTRIFLREGARFHTVDLLFTNFHLPRSSLLLLVTAFGGHDRVMDAYAHAIADGYRFYSYGDACLIARADRD